MKPLDPRLLRYARKARLPIAIVVLLGLTTAALVLVQAQLLADGITSVFTGSSANGAVHGGAVLGTTLAVLAVVVAARGAVAWAGEAAAYHASSSVKAALRDRVLAKAVELGPRWLAGERAAELTTLVTDGVEALDGYFASYLPQLVLGVTVPLAVVIRVAVADPLAGLTIAATLPLVPLFGALVGRTAGAHAGQRWAALAVLSHHFLDRVSGLATLKVFGQSRGQRAAIARVTDDYRVATVATLRVAFLSSLVLELVATLSVALVAVGVGLSLVSGHLGLRTGLLALILAPEAYLPLRQAAAQFHASTDGLAAASQALAILETPAPPTTPTTPPSTAPAAPSNVAASAPIVPASAPIVPASSAIVAVDAVSVRHPGRAEPAPSDVSVTLQPGSITVLAGPSGCGKSTLIDVLLGFAVPSSGTVRTVHRSLIGWLPQRPYLFPGSVAANIRLGWPDAPDAAVVAAASAAALDDVPLHRPVTEGGGNLSAGQIRRVALARALLPGRPVLLLDEPTAGLDPDREQHVLRTLRDAAAMGRAILIAAHHRQVIAIADHIVHLTPPSPPSPPSPPRPPGPPDPPRLPRPDGVVVVTAHTAGCR